MGSQTQIGSNLTKNQLQKKLEFYPFVSSLINIKILTNNFFIPFCSFSKCVIKVSKYFFISYLAAPWPDLMPNRVDSFTHPMVLTVLYVQISTHKSPGAS